MSHFRPLAAEQPHFAGEEEVNKYRDGLPWTLWARPENRLVPSQRHVLQLFVLLFDYKEVNELNSSLPPSLHSCWLSPLLSSRDVPIKKCLPDTDYNPHPVVPEDHRIGGISDAGIINGTNLHRSAPCNEV